MSLMDQIKNNGVTVYSDLDQDAIIQRMKELYYTSSVEQSMERSIKLFTGQGGYEAINLEMERQNALDTVDWLGEVNAISSKQVINLKEMLNAQDRESVILALELIKIKSKEHNQKNNGRITIQSKGSQI